MTIENAPQAQAATQQLIQKEVAQLLQGVGLPPLSAQGLQLSGAGAGYPSSFRVDVAGAAALASATVATAQLAALRRPGSPPPQAQIDIGHVLAETTGYFTVDGQRPDIWAPLSGLYACGGDVGQPGWVRIHANFAHHRDGVLRLLGLPQDGSVTKQAVAHALQALAAIDFEAQAAAAGLVVAAVRTPTEWAAHPQSAAVAAQPLVSITQLDSAAPAKPRAWAPLPADAAPLAGLKVLDLTRILAGPVAARCLAAQGAQVLMVNGPGLPNIEAIADVSRGKRSALLDVASDAGAAQLRGVESVVFGKGGVEAAHAGKAAGQCHLGHGHGAVRQQLLGHEQAPRLQVLQGRDAQRGEPGLGQADPEQGHRRGQRHLQAQRRHRAPLCSATTI